MLKQITIRGFKSFEDVSVGLGRLTVVFGPNAAGKSNLLEALLALSRLATQPTIAEALASPIRGRPLEMFRLPPGGIKAMLQQDKAELTLGALIGRQGKQDIRYEVRTSIRPSGGEMRLEDEYLALCDKKGKVSGQPRIERDQDVLLLRHRRSQGRPLEQKLPLPYTAVAAHRIGTTKYPELGELRDELAAWNVYYLDPRNAMRIPQGPSEVSSIGVHGESVAPFLYRLRQSQEYSLRFRSIQRALTSVIPNISSLEVEPDDQGTLDISVEQDGAPLSTRIMSEGTLRVLALCCIAANPWRSSLVAFEEPENGVHPRRIEAIAMLLANMVSQDNQQVVVTTHSPLFVAEMLRLKQAGHQISFIISRRSGRSSDLQPFDPPLDLFTDSAVQQALASPDDHTNILLQQMLQRGWLDG